MTDAVQILLQSGFAGALALAFAAWVTWRVVRVSWSAFILLIARVWGKSKTGPVWKVGLLALALWALAPTLSTGLEWIETRYLRPVYLDSAQRDTSALIAVYEAEIRKHTSPEEFALVQTWTDSTARRIGSTKIAIYEAAYLECGLDPFRVRRDGVAAGWIQFTRVGLQGLGASLEDVVFACRARDTEKIMRLTDAYLTKQAGRIPEGASLRNTIDLYLAIFAPAHIGKDGEAVVYAGRNNPAYVLNSGLDGWGLEGSKIVRGQKDGKITVREIWLCLERKKRLLIM